MKKSILLGFSMFLTLTLVTAQTTQTETKPEVKKIELNTPVGGKLERPTEKKFLKVNSAAIKQIETQKAIKEEEIEKQETNQK
jgi:hypothetical protein